MIVQDLVDFAWRCWWAGTPKDDWSKAVACMGGTLIFGLWWPRTASWYHFVTSHYLHGRYWKAAPAQ